MHNKSHSRRASTLLCVFASAAFLPAQTQQVDIVASKDNTLYEDLNGSLSNGAGSRIFSGKTGLINGGRIRRALIAFPVRGPVPPRSTIVSVRLVLNLEQGLSPGQPATLHKVSADWGEGSSLAIGGQGGGAAATTGDATWIHRSHNTVNWANAGGDFVATASATTTLLGQGAVTWASTPQLVADVQSWLDNPSQVFGWMVRTDEITTGSAVAFSSRESLTPSFRPTLSITFTPPAPTVTSVGAGCNGGGPTPLVLSTLGLPRVPNPSFALSIGGGPLGPSAVLFTLALSPVPIPIGGGCFVYIDPATLIVTLPGGANIPLPIPDLPDLVGFDWPMQALAVNGATLQLATSNASVLNFGR